MTLFDLETVGAKGLTATSVASFHNHGEHVTISFDLVQEPGHGWQIDHISGQAGDVSWCSNDLIAACKPPSANTLFTAPAFVNMLQTMRSVSVRTWQCRWPKWFHTQNAGNTMLRIALQIGIFLVLAIPGFAQDWVADRLRGDVEQMAGGQWVALVRGAVVLDGQMVRTGPNGRVDLVRGAEVLELGPATQIRVHESGGKLTTIDLTSGTVTADVERRNVQHFEVDTAYLAAIVKGTKFSVTVANGAALVEVDRGTVQVQDTINDLVVDVVRGQEAQVSRSAPLQVSGPGAVAVYTFEGERVVNGTSDVPADAKGLPAQANGSANSQGHGNENGNSGHSGNDGNNGNGGVNNGNGGNDVGNDGHGGGHDNNGHGGNEGGHDNNGNGGGNGKKD